MLKTTINMRIMFWRYQVLLQNCNQCSIFKHIFSVIVFACWSFPLSVLSTDRWAAHLVCLCVFELSQRASETAVWRNMIKYDKGSNKPLLVEKWSLILKWINKQIFPSIYSCLFSSATHSKCLFSAGSQIFIDSQPKKQLFWELA